MHFRATEVLTLVNFLRNNLFLRVASALALLPFILFFLWKGGVWSSALFSLAAVLCMREYLHMAWGRLGILGLACALAVALAPWLCTPGIERPLLWTLCLLGGLYAVAWAWHLVLGPREKAPERMGHLMAAAVYIGLGVTALAALREQSFAWVAMALVLTWANDTCAYFAGRLVGKHKMLPAISPGKTWEGFAGGLLGSIAGAYALKLWALPALQGWECLLLGAAAGLAGPLGDFSESALKRSFGKKDSGKLLPGHGGILDRVDALLFVAPVVWLHTVLFAIAAPG